MTDLVLEQLRRLGGTLTVLQRRVREAVAGEVGQAVADAVGEVLTTTLGGRLVRVTDFGGRPSAYAPTDWDDPDGGDWEDGYGSPRRPGPSRTPAAPGVSAGTEHPVAALALALAAGRWWLDRRGSAWQAAGVGLAAGTALLGGGPVARAVLGVLWAAYRLRTATDALGDGARALQRP